MNNPNIRIYAQNGKSGLDIYLCNSGIKRYITTRRSSGLLYKLLQNGKTTGELSRIKPCHSRAKQKEYHYARNLIKVVDNFIKYDLSA